jgi:hypothetical protein
VVDAAGARAQVRDAVAADLARAALCEQRVVRRRPARAARKWVVHKEQADVLCARHSRL